jgi:hypothetical protein
MNFRAREVVNFDSHDVGDFELCGVMSKASLDGLPSQFSDLKKQISLSPTTHTAETIGWVNQKLFFATAQWYDAGAKGSVKR